jgi:hypothetical protein
MKLYTEREIIESLESMELELMVNDFFQMSEPIELPSDEEIERESEVLYHINKGGSMWMPSRYDIDKANRQEGFLEGAKWLKEQILNQNKS